MYGLWLDGAACLRQALRTLNLADNEIVRLENFLQLPKLEVLDVSGNRIQALPRLERDHRRLHTVKLAHNRLGCLSDVEHLRAIKHIATLTLEGNPLAVIAHARPYTIFQLRTLDMLDGEAISAQEREDAGARFGEETMAVLRASMQQALRDEQVLKDRNEVLDKTLAEAEAANDRLRTEMKTMTRMLADKDDELSRLMHALKGAHQVAVEAQQHVFDLQHQLDACREQLAEYEKDRAGAGVACGNEDKPAQDAHGCSRAAAGTTTPPTPPPQPPVHPGEGWLVFSRGQASLEDTMLLRISPAPSLADSASNEKDGASEEDDADASARCSMHLLAHPAAAGKHESTACGDAQDSRMFAGMGWLLGDACDVEVEGEDVALEEDQKQQPRAPSGAEGDREEGDEEGDEEEEHEREEVRERLQKLVAASRHRQRIVADQILVAPFSASPTPSLHLCLHLWLCPCMYLCLCL
jgi:hypothetical protein